MLDKTVFVATFDHYVELSVMPKLT